MPISFNIILWVIWVISFSDFLNVTQQILIQIPVTVISITYFILETKELLEKYKNNKNDKEIDKINEIHKLQEIKAEEIKLKCEKMKRLQEWIDAAGKNDPNYPYALEDKELNQKKLKELHSEVYPISH